ncbi:MAG: class A beta-lactamase-related serine hydrolase [Flavobacteriales bacterium]|nr:MAG: class A beta-lactamase-related serine hydrolase [Flavobacteriales bacterium]
MNPIFQYLNDLFAKLNLLHKDALFNGLEEAHQLLNLMVKEGKVPGLAITVMREGTVLLQKGYGYANLEMQTPIDPRNTLLRTASVSKPIAATALAIMLSEQTIDLDASFYDYVPYFPKKNYDFTLRQLAGHTAGIRGYKGMEYRLNQPFSIKEGIEVFKADELLFEPGTDYHYNSYDWVLVSLAMQEASGVPFQDYVKEKVLLPLGMRNTFTEMEVLERLSGTAHLPMATFYSKSQLGFRVAAPVNNFFKLAGGGYLSTSEDIAKLGQAYLQGKIADKEVVSQFLEAEEVNGIATYYGLGWQVSQDSSGRPFYGHVGNGVGGYSNFFVYSKEQMVFAIMVNCTDPKVQETLDRVIGLLINIESGSKSV